MFYTVRYYKREFHPDVFRNRGLLGFVIRMVNWVRWKLEVLNQGFVLRILAKDQLLNKSEVNNVLKQFHHDTKRDVLDKESHSPLFPARNSEEAAIRGQGYAEGGLKDLLSQVGTEMPLRPTSLVDMAARFGTHDRAKRYAKGNKFTVVEDFETVAEVSNVEKS